MLWVRAFIVCVYEPLVYGDLPVLGTIRAGCLAVSHHVKKLSLSLVFTNTCPELSIHIIDAKLIVYILHILLFWLFNLDLLCVLGNMLILLASLGKLSLRSVCGRDACTVKLLDF